MNLRVSLLLLALAPVVAPAARPDAETTAPDDDLRIRGILESALPRTERAHALRLIVHPHLGDLSKGDYLRTALGVRYGVTPRLEATAEIEAYFAHGLKGRAFFAESGFSGLHLGSKYNLGDPLDLGWDTSVGVDWWRPVGRPPAETTDAREHFAPYVTFSHQLEDHPNWRVFFGAGFDKVELLDQPGRLRKNDLGDDAAGVSGGFLFQQGQVTYTLEATYTTMHLTRDIDRERFSLRPGFVWVIPPRFTPGGREGRWLLGLALNLNKGPDGVGAGVNAKVRVNFDFKRLVGRKPREEAKR